MIFTADVLDRVLTELAERVAARDVEVVIHVVGGSAVAIGYNPDRSATRDVDAWVNASAARLAAVAISRTSRCSPVPPVSRRQRPQWNSSSCTTRTMP